MPSSARRGWRNYRTAILLSALLILGWIWDVSLGAGWTHTAGWLLALVLVGGISALAARAAANNDEPTSDQLADAQPTDAQPVSAQTMYTQPAGAPTAAESTATEQPAAMIRPADSADFDQLIEIEQAADKLFEVAGYGATPGPASHEELAAAELLLVASLPAAHQQATSRSVAGRRAADRAVAGQRSSRPVTGQVLVGYARVEVVDGQAHLEGLSVRPRFMRKGIGSALVTAACNWAAQAGYTELTLTTFADVPWNGPFYAHLGFVELSQPSSGLLARRGAERQLGLDAMGRRIVMVHTLSADAVSPAE